MHVQGLRRDFHSSAKSFTPVLLDKFKDKNAAVCRSVTEALTNMHRWVTAAATDLTHLTTSSALILLLHAQACNTTLPAVLSVWQFIL